MDACNALIVDDEADIRELIEMTLSPLGVHCLPAETLSEARALLKHQSFSFCITDLRLPDGSGLELVAYIQKQRPNLPVAVITAHGNVESAVEALKLGAFDFVSKPFDLAVLRGMVATALRLNRTSEKSPDANRPVLLGQSATITEVRVLIAKLARSQAPILISGESGTGKELAARLIHLSGPRADQPFVPVNCGAIPEHLMESEFFGYKKGSFTGATQDKGGLFQAAQGGTLFLDEVADLPLPMQVKLLRAIQERSVRPVGALTEVATDVRVLSASHKNLAALVREGTFRQDLFYRLNVIEMRLPSLREHPDDIPELVEAILDRLSRQAGLPKPHMVPSALVALRAYAFPGNIRELENILERSFTLCEDGLIQADDLLLPETMEPSSIRSRPVALDTDWEMPPPTDAAPRREFEPRTVPILQPPSGNLEGYLEEIEKAAILRALEATRYNKTAAAEKLGITFRALRYRLKKLGME
ncbi:MAG: sigma-54-dependent Fis family transcriptional regulator [Candidatus Competibacteraceae bacterium]|uniref:Type 4 fimbriae expression regulatory protein n=1 Tax=Candidatus Contendobacter odensis Run_B_J11 TaxID=1400861 RepID=A0A7U7GAM3_9GAMM|nr:sigma-54 dependent transcriptional regulator [Candidatus Contendobacter odensis]MBK8537901.1 sigma-54-dependent Fis family transcriptional regulator [Candidatus Competibacteraceae bacterium]CDH44645.1 type 4 fimbriae expression regulatory protein [Candidatus Contendobacter odensis Run_B_J11]